MSDFIFTTNDTGKDVVTHTGAPIGRVDRVHGENRATVERTDDDGLTEKIKDMLGWGDDDTEDHQIRSEHVDRSEDDRIFLRRH